MDQVKVQIVGATGYAGGELYRLLLNHPGVEVVSLTAKIDKAEPISRHFPNLQAVTDQVVVPVEESSIEGVDVVFLCTPHGVAMNLSEEYLKHNIKVIDISGDHRLESADEFKAWYGMEHKHPERLGENVIYGLPELYREKIKRAKLLANPGCFPTSAILAIGPLLKNKYVAAESLIIDSKTGISGAGRNPSLLFHLPECGANSTAYKIAGHQHTPEIEQELSHLAGREMRISFVPHLLPTSRGMLTTVYADLSGSFEKEELRQAYRDFYKGEPFIRIKDEQNLISLSPVVGSNYCDIGVFLDERMNRAIVVSVIDNLVKGASGQAIQNMNLMFGLKEELGLSTPGWLI